MKNNRGVAAGEAVRQTITFNDLTYKQSSSYQKTSRKAMSIAFPFLFEKEDTYMISNLLYTKEGKTEEHSFKHYVFTMGEVKRLLKLYGLSTIATYSSTSKEEYNPGDPQVYIVAKKE